MKFQLFVTAAVVAAALSAPAFAAEPVGSVGVTAAHSELDLGPVSADGEGYGLDGSVALQTGPNWTVTIGAAGLTTDNGAGDDTTGSANVALTYAKDDWRLGGFVGGGEAASETLWTVGAVGQKDLGKVTLAGAAGYGNIDDLGADLWGAKGELRYFVSDTFRIDGGLGLAHIDAGGSDADLWTAGVGGEYQFAGTPWSLTAGYEHSNSDDLNLTADTIKVGVRVNFGGDLKARDRSGADLGSVTNLFGALN